MIIISVENNNIKRFKDILKIIEITNYLNDEEIRDIKNISIGLSMKSF